MLQLRGQRQYAIVKLKLPPREAMVSLLRRLHAGGDKYNVIRLAHRTGGVKLGSWLCCGIILSDKKPSTLRHPDRTAES
jgi:hypothetical protein